MSADVVSRDNAGPSTVYATDFEPFGAINFLRGCPAENQAKFGARFSKWAITASTWSGAPMSSPIKRRSEAN